MGDSVPFQVNAKQDTLDETIFSDEILRNKTESIPSFNKFEKEEKVNVSTDNNVENDNLLETKITVETFGNPMNNLSVMETFESIHDHLNMDEFSSKMEYCNKKLDQQYDAFVNYLESRNTGDEDEMLKINYIKEIRDTYIPQLEKEISDCFQPEIFGVKSVLSNDTTEKISWNEKAIIEAQEMINKIKNKKGEILLKDLKRLSMPKFKKIHTNELFDSPEERAKNVEIKMGSFFDKVAPSVEQKLSEIRSVLFGVESISSKNVDPDEKARIEYMIAGKIIATRFLKDHENGVFYNDEDEDSDNDENNDETTLPIGGKASKSFYSYFPSLATPVAGLAFGTLQNFLGLDCYVAFAANTISFWLYFFTKLRTFVNEHSPKKPGYMDCFRLFTERVYDQILIETGITKQEFETLGAEGVPASSLDVIQGRKITELSVKSGKERYIRKMIKAACIITLGGVLKLFLGFLGTSAIAAAPKILEDMSSFVKTRVMNSDSKLQPVEVSEVINEGFMHDFCYKNTTESFSNDRPEQFIKLMTEKGEEFYTYVNGFTEKSMFDLNGTIPANYNDYLKNCPSNFTTQPIPDAVQKLKQAINPELTELRQSYSPDKFKNLNVTMLSDGNQNIQSQFQSVIFDFADEEKGGANSTGLAQSIKILKAMKRFMSNYHEISENKNTWEQLYSHLQEEMKNLYALLGRGDTKMLNNEEALFKFTEEIAKTVEANIKQLNKKTLTKDVDKVLAYFSNGVNVLNFYKTNMPGKFKTIVENLCKAGTATIEILKNQKNWYDTAMGEFQKLKSGQVLDRKGLFTQTLEFMEPRVTEEAACINLIVNHDRYTNNLWNMSRWVNFETWWNTLRFNPNNPPELNTEDIPGISQIYARAGFNVFRLTRNAAGITNFLMKYLHKTYIMTTVLNFVAGFSKKVAETMIESITYSFGSNGNSSNSSSSSDSTRGGKPGLTKNEVSNVAAAYKKPKTGEVKKRMTPEEILEAKNAMEKEYLDEQNRKKEDQKINDNDDNDLFQKIEKITNEDIKKKAESSRMDTKNQLTQFANWELGIVSIMTTSSEILSEMWQDLRTRGIKDMLKPIPGLLSGLFTLYLYRSLIMQVFDILTSLVFPLTLNLWTITFSVVYFVIQLTQHYKNADDELQKTFYGFITHKRNWLIFPLLAVGSLVSGVAGLYAVTTWIMSYAFSTLLTFITLGLPSLVYMKFVECTLKWTLVSIIGGSISNIVPLFLTGSATFSNLDFLFAGVEKTAMLYDWIGFAKGLIWTSIVVFTLIIHYKRWNEFMKSEKKMKDFAEKKGKEYKEKGIYDYMYEKFFDHSVDFYIPELKGTLERVYPIYGEKTLSDFIQNNN